MVLLEMDTEGKSQIGYQRATDHPIPEDGSEWSCEEYGRVLAVLDALTATATLVLEEVPGRVAEALRHSLNFDQLNMWLFDEEHDILEPLMGPSSTAHQETTPSTLLLGQGFAGWVAENKAAMRVNDGFGDSHPGERSAEPAQSALIVPLMIGERVIGVLETTAAHRNAFTLSDERLLMTAARRLSVSIESALLYQETKRRLAEVTALYQLAQQMNTSLNIQEVLVSIVQSLKKTIKCRGCSIALLDPVDNVLEIRAAAGVEHKWEQDFKLRLGEGVAGRVALQGAPIYVPDVLDMNDFIFFDPNVRSLLTVPLTFQQRVIGTLTLDSDQPDAFSQNDERLLTIAATQAAIAIENARLYASLEQRAQNLAQAYAELKKADRLKDEIVQNISHELRTPLTFVKSYVELLLDENAGPLTDEQKSYLEIVIEKTTVVTRLVGDIMSLQQAEQPLYKREPLSLTAVANRAMQGCAATAHQLGLTLVSDFPDDLCLVSGDEDRLLQVFDNLLGNAIKFSPDGGKIGVTVKDAGNMVQASVSDQGIGIPQDEQSRIFERFYQINGSARRRFGGAGLGLAIVKRILEAHDGKVWVESQVGAGSTFYFTVPKYQTPQI
ncbi:MAG TPA: GAF domain-containing sensor histidine kinase [Chloroflexi bacterium]|nr:GAF domain-containing sensor histidine kinase [Chloroflexota bacterium]